MTFQNHIAPAAAVGFPTGEIAENVGGGKWKGPYVQNCTSDTTTCLLYTSPSPRD